MSFYSSEILHENTDLPSMNTHLSQGKWLERQKQHIIETNLTEGFNDYSRRIEESKTNTTLFGKFKSIVTNLTSESTSTMGSKYVQDKSNNYFYITGNNVMKKTDILPSGESALPVDTNLSNIGSFFTTISGENVIRGTDINSAKIGPTKNKGVPKYFVSNEIFSGSNSRVFDDTSKCSYFQVYDISKNKITNPYECMNQAILDGKRYAMLKNEVCFLSNTGGDILDPNDTKCNESSYKNHGYRYDLIEFGEPDYFGKSGYINGNLEYEYSRPIYDSIIDISYNELIQRKIPKIAGVDTSCNNAAHCASKCNADRSCRGYSVYLNEGWTFDTLTSLKDTLTYDSLYTTYLRKKKYTEGLTTFDLTTKELNDFQPASKNFLKNFVENDVSALITQMDLLDSSITNELIKLNRQYNIENENLNQSIKTTSLDVSKNWVVKTSTEESKRDEYAELLNKLDDEILQINRQSYEHLGWSLVVICLVIVSIKLINSNP